MLSPALTRSMFAAALVLGATICAGMVRSASDSPDPAAEKESHKDAYGDPLPDGAVLRLGTIRLRNSAWVAFAPDGKTLATAGGSDVRLWETATGKEITRWQVQLDGGAHALLFSPDGSRLTAVALYGHECQVWDVKRRGRLDEKPLSANFPGSAYVTARPGLSSDGATVYAGDDTTVRGWDTATAKETYCFKYCDKDEDQARMLVFSLGGTHFVTSDLVSRTVRLWDTKAKKLLRVLETDEGRFVRSCAFSPDGALLATGYEKGKVLLWDVKSGRQVGKLEGSPTQVTSLDFTPDGKVLAAASNAALMSGDFGEQAIRLWDLADKSKPLATIPAPGVGAVTFSPDAKTLAWVACDQSVRLLDWAAKKELNPFDSHQGHVYCVAFSPDGKRLASASADNTVRLWDAQTGKPLRVLQGHEGEVYTLAWSPDGRWLASGGRDRTIVLWEIETGKMRFRSDGHRKSVVTVAFSPDGKVVASGVAYDIAVRLWDAPTGKQLRSLEETKGSASSLAFSLDGTMLAAGGEEGVRLCDSATLRVLRRLEIKEPKPRTSVTALAFSPDGKSLVSGNDQLTILWETATGKERARFAAHGGAAFSVDGRRLAVVGGDGSGQVDKVIRVWELATGREVGTFRGVEAWSSAAAFSSDGRLATGGSDGTVLIWDLAVVAAKTGGARPAPSTLGAKELDAAWADLASEDAAKAYTVLRRLVVAAPQALPHLRERLQPVTAPDRNEVTALIADLDSDQFETREKASAKLGKLAELAEPALRKKLDDDPPPEVRRRIRALLDGLPDGTSQPSADALRYLRAVEVLEQIGTPDASKVLRTLAEGAEGARLTRDAEAALKRLAKQTAKP